MNVKIKRLKEVPLPKYAKPGDAGFDVVAAEDVVIAPGETKIIPTGLAFEIPEGLEIQVRPRSGITAKTKLRVQLGTIDSGFRGEVGVICDNISQAPILMARKVKTVSDEIIASNNRELRRFDTYLIRKGDRIAQLVIAPVEQATFIEVDTLEETTRGTGGFGSTGVKEAE